MVNYFELYNIPLSFHPDQAAVKAKYYELSRQHHPDRAQPGAAAEALHMSSVNNAAYKTLRDADATTAYILKLNGLLQDEEKYNLPSSFLMEMMDMNEAVSDMETNPVMVSPAEPQAYPVSSAQRMLDEQLELWESATKLLTDRFEAGDHTTELLLQVKDQYFRKKYLLRIKERIDRFAAR